MAPFAIHENVKDLSLGVVLLDEVQVTPSTGELRAWSDSVAKEAAAQGEATWRTERRAAVRALLRLGGFKPSGRSKPAQEYLLRCAVEQQKLPEVNQAVDVLNTLSLKHELPISLLKRHTTMPWLIRYGQATEKYVFNTVGQELELEGLLVVCNGLDVSASPIGSPVKDSMAGKITSEDRTLVAVIYAPRSSVSPEQLREATEDFAQAMQLWTSATTACHLL